MSSRSARPSTPKVISPTPTPGDDKATDAEYFPPTTRSAARRSTRSTTSTKATSNAADSDPDLRARTLSRSPTRASASGSNGTGTSTKKRRKSNLTLTSTGTRSPPSSPPANGHLSPGTSASRTAASRSPSPLGLIPLHTHWRSFVHRHEIPRKALHVSIGFVTLRLYTLGIQQSSIHPWLLRAALPIAAVDVLRHRWPPFNRLYVRALGALMREAEVHERYNGVVWYLAGAWVAMRAMPKDVGVMSILLLSWCDTAASTIGRKYGRYTPQIRRGKSLAGSAAACVVGVATAWLWWGYIVPRNYGVEEGFMFRGYLQMPDLGLLGGTGETQGEGMRVTGWLALGIMSVWSGIVASVSEAVDIFGWDDNLTIPVLSGIGLWGFLKVFG